VLKSLLVFGALSGLLAVEILNFTGFSYDRSAWLSDDALITIAADDAAGRNRGTYRYKSGSDLIALNKRCCSVDRDQEILWRIIGWYIVRVEINYRITDAEKENYCHAYYWIDASGKIRDFEGTTMSTSP
jgi:hypothetical protein